MKDVESYVMVSLDMAGWDTSLHFFFSPLGQGDASDCSDPELEVNEPTVLMIINQYTISVGLAGVRKKKKTNSTQILREDL